MNRAEAEEYWAMTQKSQEQRAALLAELEKKRQKEDADDEPRSIRQADDHADRLVQHPRARKPEKGSERKP